MVGGIDLYNYPRKLELTLKKLNEDSLVCDEDKQAIASFSKIRLAKGSSHERVAKIVYCLRFFTHWLHCQGGSKWHAIVGRAIYESKDMKKAVEELAKGR